MFRRHFTGVLLFALASLPVAAQPVPPVAAQPTPSTGTESSFTIFLRDVPVGVEHVSVTSDDRTRTIKGTGSLGNPLNRQTEAFEVRYDHDWKPLELTLEGTHRGQRIKLHTLFSGGTAVNEITQSLDTTSKIHQVAADTIALPNLFFGAYEALSARLIASQPGQEMRVYVAPDVEIGIQLRGVADQRIQTPGRMISARRHTLTFSNPSGPLFVEVWSDEQGRLLRIRVPVQELDVARQDIASAASRLETSSRVGDEQVRISANGFTLVGTLSAPGGTPAPGTRRPAVVLVPASGPSDRDEMMVGVAIYAQLAASLADAGYLVVRYDKRGIGQSGGRAEAVVVNDYAEDARAVVKFVKRRKDVDPKRIAVLGYSDGGWAALLAASREKDIVAVITVATASSPGARLILEQQQRSLDRMNLTSAERQAKIALQERIHTAVMSGNGWNDIPQPLRRQADTPWFRSFLQFEPTAVFVKVRQPVLVVYGELDREIPPSHADAFAAINSNRKGSPPFERVTTPGVNHLLVAASSGEIDEYGTLTDRDVSATLLATLTGWLDRVVKGTRAPAK